MDKIFFAGALISIGVVVGSLLLGLFVMARGGEKNNRISNKMMRLRVMSQGAAVIFLLLAYLSK